jgi:hypothetical protein
MIPNTMTGGQPQLTEETVRTIVQEELQKENDNG